jgi:hypothetical protein
MIIRKKKPELLRLIPYIGDGLAKKKNYITALAVVIVVSAAAVFPVALAYDPYASAKEAKRLFEAMEEGVFSIKLTMRMKRGVPPVVVKIDDKERIDRFSLLIAESQSIVFADAVGAFDCFDASVYTKSGVIDLFVAVHSYSIHGVHFKVKNSPYEIIFRNNKVGKLFADALGITIRD